MQSGVKKDQVAIKACHHPLHRKEVHELKTDEDSMVEAADDTQYLQMLAATLSRLAEEIGVMS